MAARISLLCEVDHEVHEPTQYAAQLSVYEGEWAYCRNGGRGTHEWRQVTPPLPIHQLPLTRYGRLLLPDD